MKLNRSFFTHTVLPVAVYGTITGLITGLIVWTYTFVAELITERTAEIYTFVRENISYAPYLFGALIAISLLAWLISKISPASKGSGIPYIEGVMRGLLPLKWLKAGLSMFFGSLLSFFAGMPLGCEGPSVFLGGCVGDGVNNLGSKTNASRFAWKRQNVTSGAAAGFAVAFNAPLAGIMFALEEGHKRFSPTILLLSSASVIVATITSNTLSAITNHGITNVFFIEFSNAVNPTLKELGFFLILAIVIGLVAVIYSTFLNTLNDFFKKIKIPRIVKYALAFLLTGVVGLYFSDAIGSGASLIRKIAVMGFEWKMLLILLLIKLVQVIFCSASEVQGGLTIPVMALGALLGGLMAKLFILMGMGSEYYNIVVLISMCAMLGAVIRAPIMSIVLVVEMTRVTVHLWAVCLVIILSYFIIELFRVEPVFDKSLDTILEQRNRGKRRKFVEYEMEIEPNSFAVGRSVRDVLWPANTLVINVIKTDEHGNIIYGLESDGERKIRPGDKFVIQAETDDFNATYSELCRIVKNPDFIESMNDHFVHEEE